MESERCISRIENLGVKTTEISFMPQTNAVR